MTNFERIPFDENKNWNFPHWNFEFFQGYGSEDIMGNFEDK